MLEVKTTDKFEADFKRMLRAGNDPDLFWAVVELLASEDDVPSEFRDHELQGEWAGVRDIHIEPDWLLLYQRSATELILVSTGRHLDLF